MNPIFLYDSLNGSSNTTTLTIRGKVLMENQTVDENFLLSEKKTNSRPGGSKRLTPSQAAASRITDVYEFNSQTLPRTLWLPNFCRTSGYYLKKFTVYVITRNQKMKMSVTVIRCYVITLKLTVDLKISF